MWRAALHLAIILAALPAAAQTTAPGALPVPAPAGTEGAALIAEAAAIPPGRPDRADSVALRVVAEFPASSRVQIAVARALSNSGYYTAGVRLAHRAVDSSPRLGAGHEQLAMTFAQAGQGDSAMAAVRTGIAAGADKATLGKIALKVGSDAYQKATATKKRDDLQKAYGLLMYSNDLVPSADARFLAGASAFLAGQSAINEAQATQSCQLTRQAENSFAAAQENVPAGMQAYTDEAKRLMSAISQFRVAVAEQVRRLCK